MTKLFLISIVLGIKVTLKNTFLLNFVSKIYVLLFKFVVR